MTRTFSPSEAALSVFELAKRQPQFVLRFCIIYALFVMFIWFTRFKIRFALAVANSLGRIKCSFRKAGSILNLICSDAHRYAVRSLSWSLSRSMF
jgi:hypothetical protein